MKKIIILVTIVGLSNIINIYSQSQNLYETVNKMTLIPIQNPDVAALNKFVECPVSYFNGQVDVSFPLYEIKLKDVTVPIRLKYNTGGIRVSEEASWVGLGWALDVGGVISHQINGYDDQSPYTQNYFGAYFPYQTVSDNEKYFEGMPGSCMNGGSLYNASGQLENIITKFIFGGNSKIDTEPDLYIYNMGSYSGKFIFYKGKAIDLSDNNVIFTLGSGYGSIIAITPDGNTYKFNSTEYSISTTGLVDNDPEVTRPKITAYYLSEIETVNKEQIKFSYKTYKKKCDENNWNVGTQQYWQRGADIYCFPLPPALYEDYRRSPSVGADKNLNTRNFSNRFTTFLQLETIEFPNGTIEFEKSKRDDTFGFKLDKVIIKNKNEKIKSFSFQYDYFIANNPGYESEVTQATELSNTMEIAYPVDFLKKRLKLLSFSENNDVGTKEEKYEFSYNNSSQLPYKTSFSQDFWGYYNEKYNKSSLLPSYSLYAMQLGYPEDFNTVKWAANRDVNPDVITAGMLKEITHPTKGKTMFEFEPNETPTSVLGGYQKIKKNVSAADIGVGIVQKTFTAPKRSPMNISVYLEKQNPAVNPGPCTAPGSCPLDVLQNDALCAYLEYYDESKKIWIIFDKYLWYWHYGSAPNVFVFGLTNELIDAEKFRITANFPDKYASLGQYGTNMATISVDYDTTIYNSSTTRNYAGGVRIKKVTKVDPSTNKSESVSYTYSDGVLATPLVFDYSYPCAELVSEGSQCGTQFISIKHLTASPVYPYSYSANGSLVGYRNVTETMSDGEIGKIEYNFLMSPDYLTMRAIAPAVSTYLTNGFLGGKTVYKKDQTSCIMRTEYQYSTFNAKPYWGFAISPGLNESAFCSGTDGTENWYSSAMFTCFYPILQGKVLPVSEVEYVFNTVGDPPITKETQYAYNSQGFIQSKKTQTSLSSPRNYVVETYKYPKDMGDIEPYKTMVSPSYNILTPVVESAVEQNGSKILQKTNYKKLNSNIFVPASIQMQKGTNALETRIVYNEYDLYGNLNAVVKDDAEKTVYLRSYNYQYPIAEIKGVTYADVTGKITAAALNTIAAKIEPAAADWTTINNLRTQLPNAMVTTYTYKPLVGILTVTDPRGTTITYTYDSFGRLQNVKDANGKNVEDYEYHYKN